MKLMIGSVLSITKGSLTVVRDDDAPIHFVLSTLVHSWKVTYSITNLTITSSMIFTRLFISTSSSLLAKQRILQFLSPTITRAAFSTATRIMAQEYQLKGLSSLDLKDGEKREVEVEGIEKGKVLLVRVGDKTHALSSNCTHYGAPLVKGVLTPDGRLTCAWHGGTFKHSMNLLFRITC